MKKIIISFIALVGVSILSAQTVEEALLYANQNFSGTARSSAMGGAFSSLGGDISSLSTNPAGIGIFRQSVVSYTPGVRMSKTEGVGTTGDKNRFIFPSVGFVFSSEAMGGGGLNFGISYTQGANFNQKYNLVDDNVSYSFLDDITREANFDTNGNFKPWAKKDLENYKGGLLPSLAYNTYLLNPRTDGGYVSALMDVDKLNRRGLYDRKGSLGEIAFTVGGNSNDFIYWGLTLGVQTTMYKKEDKYSEKVANPSAQTTLKEFYQDTFLETKGGGVNLKAGAIVRPVNSLRLGLAIHTPTFFTLEDQFLYVMDSYFFKEPEAGKGTSFRQTFPTNNSPQVFEYEYRTPWKFILGGSYIFGKTGLLSVDYELMDYSSSRYSSSQGNFDDVNDAIKRMYQLTGNLKVGGEVKLFPAFSLRAGYNHFGNMYSKESNREQKAMQFSGGLGYRHKKFALDVSLEHYTQENQTHFYKQDGTLDFTSKQNLDANTVKLTLSYQL